MVGRGGEGRAGEAWLLRCWPPSLRKRLETASDSGSKTEFGWHFECGTESFKGLC